jgi:hypothetical protein
MKKQGLLILKNNKLYIYPILSTCLSIEFMPIKQTASGSGACAPT